ncbi:hypothetical protein Trydic_g13671 [Trypoxylus dichotomus]
MVFALRKLQPHVLPATFRHIIKALVLLWVVSAICLLHKVFFSRVIPRYLTSHLHSINVPSRQMSFMFEILLFLVKDGGLLSCPIVRPIVGVAIAAVVVIGGRESGVASAPASITNRRCSKTAEAAGYV